MTIPHSRLRRVIAALLGSCVLLSGCAKSSPESDATAAKVTAAKTALTLTLAAASGDTVTRPGSLLSVYAALYLAGTMAEPVRAALDGIEAQLRMNTVTDSTLDEEYELLMEFAAILHVDLPDLLNRSEDRTYTLDQYVIGLGNITERSRRRTEDVESRIGILSQDVKEQKADVKALERQIRDAQKAQDYQTVGQLQQELGEANTALATDETKLEELEALRDIFAELLEIADARQTAIAANREILIAGLSASDIPGVEDLGVIEGRTRGRGGFNPFRGR